MNGVNGTSVTDLPSPNESPEPASTNQWKLPVTFSREEELKSELSKVLNCHSVDNTLNTPDYLLADYLVECLKSYGTVKAKNDRWHGASAPMVLTGCYTGDGSCVTEVRAPAVETKTSSYQEGSNES